MKNDFVVFLTGVEDSMSLAWDFLIRTRREIPTVIPFKLCYTPPYQRFLGIQSYQIQLRYHPFMSTPRKAAAVILDLSEWVGYEQEDYLRYFLEYLHDADLFYEPEYVVTLGAAKAKEAENLYRLLSRYLGTGALTEDRTLVDRNALSAWLKRNYPLEKDAATALAKALLQKKIPSLDWIQTITEDLMRRINRKGMVTVQHLVQAVPGSKLELLCGASGEAFHCREMEDKE